MSENDNTEMNEFEEAFKILDKNIKEHQKLLEKEEEEEKTEEEVIPELKEDTIITQQTNFYMNIFLTLFITLINPILKKYNIEIITTEETEDLSKALMNILSSKILSKTSKVGLALSKVVNLPKILKLIMVFWSIGFPRITKYLETKKNKTPGIPQIEE